jgi:RHS repeat-associated protein
MRVRLLIVIALFFLGASAANAQCQAWVSSFTVSTTHLVGGSNQTGVGTIGVTTNGQGCNSSLQVGIGINPLPSDISWPGSVWTSGSTATFAYSSPYSIAQPVSLTFIAYVVNGQPITLSQTINILPATMNLTISPSGFVGNGISQQATGTLQLGAPVNASTTIGIQVSPPVGVVGTGALTIQAGQTTGTFSIRGDIVNSTQTAVVTATYAIGLTASAPVTVFPTHGDIGSCPRHCEDMAGSPINLINGNVWTQQKDYSLPGFGGGLQLARTWNSLWPSSQSPAPAGTFGLGWWSTYEERLTISAQGAITYWRGDGDYWFFTAGSDSGSYVLVSPPDERVSLQYASLTGQYTMTFKDGSTRIFNGNGYLLSLADRNGNQTTIAYDSSNRIKTVMDPANRVLTFNYANSAIPNLASSVQDAVGVIANYAYGANGNLTQVTYADGSFLAMAYDGSNQLTSVTDTNGKTLETHTYDSTRRGLTSQRANGVDAVSVSFSYFGTDAYLYDSKSDFTDYAHSYVTGEGLLTSVTGSGCDSCGARGNSTFTYDSLGNRTSSTDALGNVTNYTYDMNANMLSKSIKLSANQTLTWSYTYNSFGEVLTATDPLGNVTTNAYDAKGNLLSTMTPSPDGVRPGSKTTFTYDGKGDLLTVADPLNNKTTMTYTTVGLLASVTDAQNNKTTFTYDNRGNRLTAVDAASDTTSYTYDLMNRLTKITYADTTTTAFGYDSRGRRTSVTDQNGKTTSYTYDDADRLTTITDAANHVTTYAYDTENNLTTIKDALGRSTSFTYDIYGRVTKTTFPSTLTETYTYDADNDLLSKTDRKSQTIQYAYDALNRLTQNAYPGGATVGYSYDGDSRLTQATDSTGTYQFTFDNMGRLTGATTSYSFLTGRNFTNAYSYDAASNRTGFTDPENGLTAYTYDTLNRLKTLAPPSAFSTSSFGFSYDALSRRTQMTRPNNVTTSYTYDNLSRLLSVLHQAGGSTIDGAGYTVDSVGNRMAKTDKRVAVTSNYTYDAIYRLTQVTQATNTTESYSYDAVGNRTASLGVSSYTTNASNELTATSNASYTYDSNGNMLTKTVGSNTTSYTWDFENRLTSVTLAGNGGTVTFKYDSFGRRIYKSSSSGTSVFAYDGDSMAEETNASGTVVARYSQTEKIDQPLAMLRSGTTSFYEADGLGSVTSLTNSSGAVGETYAYDSFGKQTASSGSLTNPSQYTGREMDAETGLYYYRARYFDPIVGHFLSQDPIGIRGGINFYRYADNQPSNQNDPSGLAPQKFGKQVSPPTEGFPFLPNGGFFWYGNWGGPGWTGGQLLPYENLTPDQRANLAPPIDEQDACYMGHDLCYSRVRVSYSCKDMSSSQRNNAENRAEGGCDIELYYCLKSISKQNFFSRFAQPVFSILELLK